MQVFGIWGGVDARRDRRVDGIERIWVVAYAKRGRKVACGVNGWDK